MNIKTGAFAIAMIAAMMLTAISYTAPTDFVSAEGTRVGEVGWQYDAFEKNLVVNVTPEHVTTMDQITVTVTSIIPEVWIKQASIYGVVYPNDGVQFPFSFPFLKVNETSFMCLIEPFPLNGYEIEFYVFVYDYFYESMDSRTYASFEFSVTSSGWRNDTFAENIELFYWPMNVNATQDVVVTLISKNNISIQGANLYVTYQTTEGEVQSGGWNFTKTNADSTEMHQTIPGYPAGTNITFWVTAWDQYSTQMTSKMFNYSVMGIAEYTDFPFEYTDEADDRSQWIPDDTILLPMAAMAALGIPLFIYLYALNLKRQKRARDMIVMKKAEKISDASEEVFEDE